SSELETINNYFIKDILDKPQTTLQSLLISIEAKNIIETWRICCIDELSHFIVINQKKHKGNMDEPKENVSTENFNSKEDQDTEEIILLQ
ncbi:27776_t:CDS:2, partial [Racocetra persica]